MALKRTVMKPVSFQKGLNVETLTVERSEWFIPEDTPIFKDEGGRGIVEGLVTLVERAA